MKAQGKKINPEPGMKRNMLMSAMTGDDMTEIDCPHQAMPLKPGDRLILSSDGLDTLTHGENHSDLAGLQDPSGMRRGPAAGRRGRQEGTAG